MSQVRFRYAVATRLGPSLLSLSYSPAVGARSPYREWVAGRGSLEPTAPVPADLAWTVTRTASRLSGAGAVGATPTTYQTAGLLSAVSGAGSLIWTPGREPYPGLDASKAWVPVLDVSYVPAPAPPPPPRPPPVTTLRQSVAPPPPQPSAGYATVADLGALTARQLELREGILDVGAYAAETAGQVEALRAEPALSVELAGQVPAGSLLEELASLGIGDAGQFRVAQALVGPIAQPPPTPGLPLWAWVLIGLGVALMAKESL